MNEGGYQAEIGRLRGLNARNATAYKKLQASAREWKQRALVAEGRLDERRKGPVDPTEKFIRDVLFK